MHHPLAPNEDVPKKTHRRRRRSSGKRKPSTVLDTTVNQDHDDSPAFQSLVDIISEMKRLPSISVTTEDHLVLQDSSNDWKRVRRHSEPPNKHQTVKQNHHSQLKPIHEKPVFSNSFLALEENGENNIEFVVSPLANGQDHLTSPKRSRSKSVPNTLSNNHQVSNNNNNNNTRKQLYPTHLNVPDASALVRSRQLYAGILKVDIKDSSEANVLCEELDASIYIFGSRNRNRALDGDEVAVELVDVDDMLNERQTKRQARHTRRLSVISQSNHSLTSNPEELLEEELETIKARPKYCGKVVCILERPRNMLFSGTLSLNRPYAKLLDNTSRDRKDLNHPKIIWFIPADKRLPLVAVPIKHAPPDFIKYHEEYKNRIFIGNIQRWPATSLHPFGTVEKEIGWMGELGVHSAALMADHHIKDMEFSESVLKAVAAIPAKLEPNDKKGRRDLTKQDHPIFTVNGQGDDIDYAFSIKLTDSDVYQVGIHVTDLSHFVRIMTPLDREARQRSCSVDLIDKRVSILPPDFTKSHCSLVQGQERLAFSVLCKITNKGVLLHTWIGKTVIRVQEALENDMNKLLGLCEKIQYNRITKNNGLSLSRSYEQFELTDSGYPKEIHCIEQSESEVLIQELLILANTEVGQKLSSHFPDQTLLCRQDPPKNSKLADIQDYFENDPLASTIQGLHKLVNLNETCSNNKQKTLVYLIQQSIPPAKYFSAGGLDSSKYHHFSYGASIYATFTSPIHNYASIYTQRQLCAALKGEEQTSDNYDETDKVARHCNSSQLSKYAAEQDSKKLYVAAYIYRQCLSTNSQDIMVESFIVGLNENMVEVYIPDYDLELSIDHQQQHSNQFEYNSSLNQLKVVWDDVGDTSVFTFLSPICISIHVDMKVIRPIFDVKFVKNIM